MARKTISEIYNRFNLLLGKRFSSEERGASLVEYSLLIAFIAFVAFIAVGVVGRETASNISDVVSGL